MCALWSPACPRTSMGWPSTNGASAGESKATQTPSRNGMNATSSPCAFLRCNCPPGSDSEPRMDLGYLGLSLLRVVGLLSLFVASWLSAYAIGQLVAQTGWMECRDEAECELMAAVIVMPLGGTALYFLCLVLWSIVSRRRPSLPRD